MHRLSVKWAYLLALAVIWGTSFILIKKALHGFTPVQLGGLRILFASLFLFLIGFRSVRTLSLRDWKWVCVAGFLSSFFPPFLFALAQTQLDSGITSIFNSLSPLFTAMVGVLLFGTTVSVRQIIGVVIGLSGVLVLMVAGSRLHPEQDYGYAIFILMSALGYAFNINIVKKHLLHLSPLAITTSSFGVIVIPAIAILVWAGTWDLQWTDPRLFFPLGCVFMLAILGTGISNILFNQLIKISSPVYAASVTYLIPLVAILWGMLDGEVINFIQLGGGVIILYGVYLVHMRKS